MKIQTFVMLVSVLIPAVDAMGFELPKKIRTRSAAVEEIRNENSKFVVRVDVDRADRTYVEGDVLRAAVKSQRAGYLYLLYLNAKGETICLFPNRHQTDNRIEANTVVPVPGPDANFRIRIQPPLGREVLKAVVSMRPLTSKELEADPSGDVVRQVSEKGVRSAAVELVQEHQSSDWADHQIELTTVPKRTPPKQGARYGIIVSLAKYKDANVRALPACAKDAELMKQLFEKHGSMNEVLVLQDEEATRANVEKLFKVLAEGTKPGDEVFIFWTGHGASVSDTSGDEADGVDEVLVTYDVARDDIGKTGVLDDVLRRWVQDLDGRRVIFIADTCLAGGFAGTGKELPAKGLFSEFKGEKGTAAAKSFDLFDNEFAQTKDIGQKETAVLCSSTDHESSLVRRDGAASVMTGFLVDFVNGSSRPVTLDAAYEYVKVEVPRYVQERFQGANQQPQFLNNLSSPAFLRP